MSYTFVIGFERCGTHGIVDILKKSCRVPAFIKHEDSPHLCYEAYRAVIGNGWETPDLKERVERYRGLRSHVRLVCEGNHRLGFFAKYLHDKLPGSKFVLLVRDPVETLVSLVATLAHWPEILHRYPDYFQAKVKTAVPKGKDVFNLYRPKPPDLNAPLHELYLWEWMETYRRTIAQIADVDQVMVMETRAIAKTVGKLLAFVGEGMFDPTLAAAAAQVKSDSVYDHHDKADTIAFARDLIEPHADEIRNAIRKKFPGDGIISRIST